jgi:hypothetical protein
MVKATISFCPDIFWFMFIDITNRHHMIHSSLRLSQKYTYYRHTCCLHSCSYEQLVLIDIIETMKPVNPFYETTDSVRQVLSEKYNHGMNNISKYKKEKVLTIADALER